MSPRRPARPATETPARGGRRHYVVHDRQGRILALAPVTAPPLAGEVRTDWRPMPVAGQRVVEIDLEPAQLALGLDVVIVTFRVDTGSAKAAVLRRITRRA